MSNRILHVLTFAMIVNLSLGQTFTEISSGDIGDDPVSPGYSGASFIDYDGDEDLDLFINPDRLYENDGTGVFFLNTGSGIVGSSSGDNNGNTWADLDNDGDLDLALVNQDASAVYLNNGDGTFTPLSSDDISFDIDAWAASWGDYNNDGHIDLVATNRCGSLDPCSGNWLYENNGNGSFTSILDSDVSTGTGAFTVANWVDHDEDGDMDLFIASGENDFASEDHFYINQLVETGTADLTLNQSGTLFGDLRDGQNWNLFDYDNDGDLDGYVTNYLTELPNDFYRNNGDGTYTQMGLADLGVHMSTEEGNWVGNTWGDYNNDGWLDVIMTADFGSPFGNHMYLNTGEGTFVHHFPSFANQLGSRAVVNGDYDNDGDLDLFINGTSQGIRGLFRNNLSQSGNAHWMQLSLEGTVSNRSAVGATARMLATINGQQMWLRRDVSSQNAYCGQNDLRLHFGLGNATEIDSLVIEWPLGLVESFGSLESDQMLQFVEGSTTGIDEEDQQSQLFSVYPNPASDRLDFTLSSNSEFTLEVYDASMRLLTKKVNDRSSIELQGWSEGLYYLVLMTEGQFLQESFTISR